jgi:hypothetical protein
MKIGQVLRYPRDRDPSSPVVDDLANFYFETHLPGHHFADLSMGITAVNGPRRPAILIRCSPHKVGSETTPWQDTFDPDNGHVRST